MKSYNNSNQVGGNTLNNGKGRLSHWSTIPDDDFLAKIYKDAIPRPEVEGYLAALKQYLHDCPDAGEDYFIAVDHHSRVELYLDNAVDFDEEIAPVIATQSIPFTKSFEKKPSLTQEQLIAEIEQLIDENPPESKLQELLPFLAKLATLSTRDVQAIYSAKLAELENSQSPEELRKDLDELLAIGGESLNLYEYLPPPLAEPLLRLANRMAIRPEVFLLTLLTAISSLHKVGTNLTISAEDKFIVPPNIFSGIIAESGQKKSPVLRVLVKYPLDALEKDANEQLRLVYEQALEEWQDCPESERKEQFPDGEPKPPTPIDYYFTDGTVEGVNRQFSRFPERGVLYLRDELAGVFAFDKYRSGKGTERQDFLSFYDGFGKKELRADGFTSRVKQVLVSIFGTIQPDILRQLMKDPLAADGQWARFLFVIQPLQPATLQRSGHYDINTELLNPLYRRIDQLPVMQYKLAPDAADYYERHYNQLEIKRTTHPDPAMRAVFSKMEGTIGRLALNLHVIYELLRGESKVNECITKARIIQACKLAKFFINQIRLINATVVADSDSGEIAPNLAAIVERSRRAGAVDARNIRRSINAFRDATVQEIRTYFRQLAELGYGSCDGAGSKMTFTAHQISVQSTSGKS
jgi:hypothetical protein